MHSTRAMLLFAFLMSSLAAAPTPPPASEVHQVPPDHAQAVLGEKIDNAGGKTIGRLVDILVGPDGEPRAAVIDFGGFMGVGSRKIAVQWSTLHFAPGDPSHAITLDLTPDQIKAAPEYRNPEKPAPVVVPSPASDAVDTDTASRH
jgi:PRC-barrel domain